MPITYYSEQFLEPLAREILGPHVKVWCLGRGRDTGNLLIIKIAVGAEAVLAPTAGAPLYKILEKTIHVLGGEDGNWYRLRFMQLKETMPDPSFWFVPEDYKPKALKPLDQSGPRGPRVPFAPSNVAPIYAKQAMATIAKDNIAPVGADNGARRHVSVDMGTVRDTDMGNGIDFGNSQRGVEQPTPMSPSQPTTESLLISTLSKMNQTMVELKEGINTVVSNTTKNKPRIEVNPSPGDLSDE